MIPDPRRHVRVVAALMILGFALAAPVPIRADDLRDGRDALKANQLDQALTSFEKAASQGYAEGRAGVGQVWLKRRQYAKAMEAFQLAQKMDAGLALAYYGQGEVLRRQGKCADALPLLEKAVDLDHKFPEAQLTLGDCFIATGQHEQAVKAYSPGLNWGPKWRPRFLVALGDAELSRDSLLAAGIYYTKAREESPDDPAPHRALGDFYVKRGTFELAVPEYQAALDKDTSDVELRYGLGRALFYAQHYNDALEVYRAVVARDPEFPPGEYALGDLLYRSGAADRRRFAEAQPYLTKYVALSPDDPKGWGDLGKTLAQLGQQDQALEAMNRAEKLGEKNKEMYTLRARIEIEQRKWDEALKDYELGDPQPEDQLRIAQLYVIKGESDKAESLYVAIIAPDSTSASARFAQNELGKLRFRAKDYAGAISLFQRRIALDPNSDEAYYYMGLSYKELKQYPEALVALRKAAQLGEAKADRQFWLGVMYAQLDSTEGARRAFTRVVELDSAGTSKNTGIALRQLGYPELLKKNYPEAIRLLVRAVTINDQDIQAWIWLGQAYQNTGNKDKACEAYRRVLRLDPNQPDARRGVKILNCP